MRERVRFFRCGLAYRGGSGSWGFWSWICLGGDLGSCQKFVWCVGGTGRDMRGTEVIASEIECMLSMRPATECYLGCRDYRGGRGPEAVTQARSETNRETLDEEERRARWQVGLRTCTT